MIDDDVVLTKHIKANAITSSELSVTAITEQDDFTFDTNLADLANQRKNSSILIANTTNNTTTLKEVTVERKKRIKVKDDDKGSIWTSYSDLFTAVAIIFLVMFVFALLRTSVMSLKAMKETKEQKEYYEGKVSEKTRKENEERKSRLKLAVNEMKDFDDVISKKMQELNKFSKKMASHKVDIEKLLKDQTIKD